MKNARHKKNEAFALGVDVGGSHITAALVDLHNIGVVEGTLERAIVDAHGTAEEILDNWYRTIDKVKGRGTESISHVGIAMPGPFDYEGGVALIHGMHKYDSIFGADVKRFLAQKLSLEEENILFRNDTEAFLEGEVLAGVARGYGISVAVTLGTGLGSARSFNGFTEDRNLGVFSLHNGIAEDYLSTRWFVKRYRELSGGTIKGVKELVELGRENRYVQQLFQEFSGNLASFLMKFIRFEKPDIVVIGGNIALASDFFLPQVSRLLEKHLDKVVLCQSLLGEKAALIGAVHKWIRK